jgi:hypothetical protein
MLIILYGHLLLFIELSDIGDMTTVCRDCGALVWYAKRAEKHMNFVTPKVSICCMKGKITTPFMPQPPSLIRNMFIGLDPRSTHFVANLRSYNNMFAFTSLGGRIKDGMNDGRGPPQFVISGHNYHRIGSLVPSDGV